VLDVADKHLVVALSDSFKEAVAALLRLFHHVVGDWLWLDFVVAREDERMHLHEVNDAFEGVLGPDGDLYRQRPCVEPLADHLDCVPEIGAHAVHLIDEAYARYVVAVRLAPDRLRLALHAGDSVEHNNASVKYSEASFHFNGEVYVAGCVHDVDYMVFPARSRRRGGDRDAALSLLRHPVHDGSTGVNLTYFVRDPRVIEDPLGDSCLAGIDMRDNSDIAHPSSGTGLLMLLTYFPEYGD